MRLTPDRGHKADQDAGSGASDPEAEREPGLAQLVPDPRVRDLGDDLPGGRARPERSYRAGPSANKSEMTIQT